MNLSCTVPSCLGFGWEMILTLRRTRKHSQTPTVIQGGSGAKGVWNPLQRFRQVTLQECYFKQMACYVVYKKLFILIGYICKWRCWVRFTLPKLSKEQQLSNLRKDTQKIIFLLYFLFQHYKLQFFCSSSCSFQTLTHTSPAI